VKKRFTRREFLETGLIGSIATGAACLPAKPAPRPGAKSKAAAPAHRPGLVREQLSTLGAAMDEIIPATDGMPSARQVGGVAYLDNLCRRDGNILKSLTRSLAALEKASYGLSGKAFTQLSHAARVQALTKLEQTLPARLFTTLRDFTYEAYYTRPKVWKLIGYEFHPTDGAGPTLKPFDEAVLTEMRKRPRYYREVD
jgi:hypothetical protein